MTQGAIEVAPGRSLEELVHTLHMLSVRAPLATMGYTPLVAGLCAPLAAGGVILLTVRESVPLAIEVVPLAAWGSNSAIGCLGGSSRAIGCLGSSSATGCYLVLL